MAGGRLTRISRGIQSRTTRRLAKTVKRLVGLVHPEEGIVDSVIAINSLQAGTIQCLNFVPQGDDSGQRRGNTLFFRSLSIKCTLSMHSSALASQLRIIIFKDKSGIGTVPTPADVLQITGTVNSVNSPLSADRFNRFSVLYDRKWSLSINGNRCLPIVVNIRRKFKVWYTGASSTDTFTNALYLLTVSNEPTAGTQVSLDGVVRFKYLDN